MAKYHCRSIFLSDTHLGARGCRAAELARFLKKVRCENLYLVGDIIDMWRLKNRWYWPAEHNDVVRRILKLAKKGTRVTFIPGNHDEAARQYRNHRFGGVRVVLQAEHLTADGRRFLVTHGDQFDLVVQHSRWLSMLGSASYEMLVRVNHHYNRLRALMGQPYYSLSHAIKLKVKRACTFVSRFEETLIEEAVQRKCDGVICGHIHKPEQRTTDTGVEYLNCGDWIEGATAVVEHHDGRLELVQAMQLIDNLPKPTKKKRSKVMIDIETLLAPTSEKSAEPQITQGSPTRSETMQLGFVG